jgi:hypothetical protein
VVQHPPVALLVDEVDGRGVIDLAAFRRGVMVTYVVVPPDGRKLSGVADKVVPAFPKLAQPVVLGELGDALRRVAGRVDAYGEIDDVGTVAGDLIRRDGADQQSAGRRRDNGCIGT